MVDVGSHSLTVATLVGHPIAGRITHWAVQEGSRVKEGDILVELSDNDTDLNRNFPTSNWNRDPVHYKSRANDARDIALSPGSEPASEPETKALLALLDRLKPRAVVSLHSALACVDDAGASRLGRQLAERSALPFLTEIGYPTPGSMGTWAGEQRLNLVTLELEDASLYALKDRHVPILIDLMTGRFDLEE